MLVYIRESDKDKIACNVDEKDIAEHLQVVLSFLVKLLCGLLSLFTLILLFGMLLHIKMRLKKEQEEKERKRKEKAEAHLYTVIKVGSIAFFLWISCIFCFILVAFLAIWFTS